MNNKLFKNSVIGFVFVSVLGTLGHFLYKWSGYNLLIGLFFPVNESVWEHLKLLFFPYLIWTIIQYFLQDKKCEIIIAKSIGAIAGMLSIVMFFYTYTGISGKTIDILNVISFFIGVIIAFAVDYLIIKFKKLNNPKLSIVGIIIFIIICAMFVTFTVVPPLIPLFKDPQTATYGI